MEWIGYSIAALFVTIGLCYYGAAFIVMRDRKKRIAEYDSKLRYVYAVIALEYDGDNAWRKDIRHIVTDREAAVKYCEKMNEGRTNYWDEKWEIECHVVDAEELD